MLKLVSLDERVSIFAQLDTQQEPVVLINLFQVDLAEADQLVEAWAADAALMKQQPGFVSTQLHRGIAGSGVFFNYAVWTSVAAFRQAFAQPEFQMALQKYPSSAVASPHLFSKVAVPGICDG